MAGLQEIRADFDATTITVYQAYAPDIALPALAAGAVCVAVLAGAHDLDKAVVFVDDGAVRVGAEAEAGVGLGRAYYAGRGGRRPCRLPP